jgi:hypothetical protein
MRDGGDNITHMGPRFTGEDNWRIRTDHTKKIRAHILINFSTVLHIVTGIYAVGIKKLKKNNDTDLPNMEIEYKNHMPTMH